MSILYLNEKEKRKNRSESVLKSGGINTRHKIADNEFSDCLNLSSDAYPCIMPRSERIIVGNMLNGAKYLATPEYSDDEITSFTGIAGIWFYYNGTKIDNIALSGGKKSIAKLGSKIYIFPDKVYFDCADGTMKLHKMETTAKFDVLLLNTTVDSETGEYKSLMRGQCYFSAHFNVGDSLILSGCSEEKNNSIIPGSDADESDDRIFSIIVQSMIDTTMYVKLYNRMGKEIPFYKNARFEGKLTLKNFVPSMQHICVCGGRLWGTSEDARRIFTSRKGDARSYGTMNENSVDCWNGIVDDDNPFTGIIERGGTVVAFKKNALFQIYGDRPSNFSIKKIDLWGSADERSIAALGSSVFYLGNHGFYKYSGGTPKLISDNLTKKYIGCVGGSDGQKYYACAYLDNGECDMLVYDPRYEVWHRESSEKFVDFIAHNGILYGATSDYLMKMYGGEPCDWYAESKRYTEDTFDRKRLGFIWIRAEMPQDGNGSLRVSARADDGEFKEFGCMLGKGFITRKIPIRLPECDSYQIRLDGNGNIVVHDIERILI